MLDIKLLKKLTEAFSPSGEEDAVRSIIAQEIKPYVDSLKIDGIGNLIATVGDERCGMICAHMDEVGFMVTSVEKNGKLTFSCTGGIDPKNLSAKRVLIGKHNIMGVISATPIHLKKGKNETTDYSDLFILVPPETIGTKVFIGDRISFISPLTLLGDKNNCVAAKALDNRLGCYILIKLICERKIKDGTFAFTVQEEAGLCGAAAIVRNHKFPFGIALDTTTANDLPGIPPHLNVCKLEGGCVLSFADGATVYSRDLIRKIGDRFDEKNIKWQTKTKRTGGNEASALEKVGFGMPSVSLSTPCRYIHGPVGLVYESDILSVSDATCEAFDFMKGHAYA